MCVSRFYKVLRHDGPNWVVVEDLERAVSRASLIAYDGDDLAEGNWVSVHSGYVIDRVDGFAAASVVEEIRRVMSLTAGGDVA
jgi:hydrogenase maturation factor